AGMACEPPCRPSDEGSSPSQPGLTFQNDEGRTATSSATTRGTFMSSPSQPGSGGRDGHMQYAPPGARAGGGPPPGLCTNNIVPLPAGGRPGRGAKRDAGPRPPVDLDDRPLTQRPGRKRRKGNPIASPPPPMRERGGPRLGMLTRFVMMTAIVAVAACTM